MNSLRKSIEEKKLDIFCKFWYSFLYYEKDSNCRAISLMGGLKENNLARRATQRGKDGLQTTSAPNYTDVS